MSIEGKTCIVTGAANGVGRAIARRFAQTGANVMMADIDEKRLAQVAENFEDENLPVQYFAADLGEKLSVANLISATIDAFDDVDILVNSARVIEHGSPMDDAPEQAMRLFDKNVLVNLKVSRAVANKIIRMRQDLEPEDRRDAAIINITSIASVRTIDRLGTYAIASAALDQLTRSLAISLAPSGIRVNGIALGSVMSAFLLESLKDNDELRDKVVAATPMHRIGDSDEAANAALFLASPEASFVTGQILTIDGGRTLVDPLEMPAY